MQQYDNFDLFLFGVFFALVSSLWFLLWVMPSDARNLQIAACQLEMGDRSFEAYETCVSRLQPAE